MRRARRPARRAATAPHGDGLAGVAAGRGRDGHADAHARFSITSRIRAAARTAPSVSTGR
jgi:hypothetical protein